MILFEFAEHLDKSLPVDNEPLIKWLRKCAEKHAYTVSFVRYYFTDNKEIVEINQSVFNRSYPTDVISLTFPYFENLLHGEIFISLEQVQSNAREYGTTYAEEFLRVAVHGLLHLCGYDDYTQEQKALMRQYEDECIRLFS